MPVKSPLFYCLLFELKSHVYKKSFTTDCNYAPHWTALTVYYTSWNFFYVNLLFYYSVFWLIFSLGLRSRQSWLVVSFGAYVTSFVTLFVVFKLHGLRDVCFVSVTLLPLELLSTSLYFSKRGAYWDRLCRDVVGWLSRACTVAKQCILGL